MWIIRINFNKRSNSPSCIWRGHIPRSCFSGPGPPTTRNYFYDSQIFQICHLHQSSECFQSPRPGARQSQTLHNTAPFSTRYSVHMLTEMLPCVTLCLYQRVLRSYFPCWKQWSVYISSHSATERKPVLYARAYITDHSAPFRIAVWLLHQACLPTFELINGND